jgi:hypothetical protein
LQAKLLIYSSERDDWNAKKAERDRVEVEQQAKANEGIDDADAGAVSRDNVVAEPIGQSTDETYPEAAQGYVQILFCHVSVLHCTV